MDNKSQRAFERLKSELASKPVVQPYSLKNEVTITTDASEKAIGGVLSQEGLYVSKMNLCSFCRSQTHSIRRVEE